MKDQYINICTGREGLEHIVKAVQSDSGRVLKCVIEDMAVPSGAEARIYAVKPSGAKIYNDCTIEGNIVSVKLTTQMLAETGRTRYQIEVVHEGETVTAFTCFLDVRERLGSDDAIESMDESTVLDRYIADMKQSVEKAESEADEAQRHAEAAAASQADAEAGAEAARQSRTAAEESDRSAAEHERAAKDAQTGAETAKAGADEARDGARTAKTGAETAERNAQNWAKLSESYARGGTDAEGRADTEDTDNAKYYAEQAAASAAEAAGYVGGEATEETAGVAKLYKSTGGNEDGAMTQKAVTDALLNAAGDTAESAVTFASADVADGNATEWTAVEPLASGEKHSSLLGKISRAVKNVRFLFRMLGTTDIASIGNGTVTGALSALNSTKVSTSDSRLTDARTPVSHNHNDLYYTEAEINSKVTELQNSINSLNANKVNRNITSSSPQNITITDCGWGNQSMIYFETAGNFCVRVGTGQAYYQFLADGIYLNGSKI